MPRPTFRKKKENPDEPVLKFSNEKIWVGSVRKTQLITTFGIGSIVDFKDDTVVIASGDDWDYSPNTPEEVENRKIFNENLSVLTGAEYFMLPRTSSGINSFSREKNIPAYLFPEKQYCSHCGNLYDIHELNIHKRHDCPQCKKKLTASRFIIVCANGHMDDFPYDWWVHAGSTCPSHKPAPRIRMRNLYNKNDIGSLRLECTECNASRSMMQIFNSKALADFKCTCNHPHFKDPKCRVSYGCDMPVSARMRSSVGVYFSVTQSALLIPPWSRSVLQYMQKHYHLLKNIPLGQLPQAIREGMNCQTFSDDEILRSWEATENAHDKKKTRTETDVMRDEYQVLSEEENTGDERFSSYAGKIPEKYAHLIDHISVIDRLTVTQAFTGFTRTTRNEAHKADIFQYPKKWFPAVELTGEGIFIRFHAQKVQTWAEQNVYRYHRMERRMQEMKFTFERFSAVYVMLHTFAHLFIREISNICGYSASSIREKIYSEVNQETNQVQMCGILIYVSSSDSDSSLGGLISIADDVSVMKEILDSMLTRADWCSGDPLCISSMQQGYQNLNYAACHDCTLLPETSCERFNVFLDRASITGTHDNKKSGFFS